LLEPQRTNIALYSEQINTGFTTSQGGTGLVPVITANTTISPDGSQNADTIVFDAGAGTTASDQSALYQFFGGTTATYTGSFYAKTASGTAQIQVRIDGAAYEKFTITNQWQRFTLTRALTGTGNGIDIAIRRGLNEPMNASATIQLWGVQVELGAYATSYIPTLGASVTRVADAASKTGISSLIGQTEGTLFADVNWTFKNEAGSPVVGILTINNNVANLDNCIILGIERQTSGINRVYCLVQNAGATEAGLFGSSISSGRYKIALAYKANDFVLYVNGVQIATDTSGSVPTTSQVLLGPRFNGDSVITDDRIAQALLFKTRLTNAQLAELTTI
jgi:hypothetical protein